MIKKILLGSMCCLFYIQHSAAETGYDFVDESGEYLSCQLSEHQARLKKYDQFVHCEGKKICVKAKPNNVCFEDRGTDGEAGGVSYSLVGVMPENKVVVIRYLGYEEYFDYFISQTTGEVVFELPSVFNGASQTSRSPDRQYMIITTTNNGYDGNPFLTQLSVVKLQPTKVEGKVTKWWEDMFGIVWMEPVEGFHTYDIQWLDNTTVKISARAPQNDYIILQRIGAAWQVKEQNYSSWKEYQYIESN